VPLLDLASDAQQDRFLAGVAGGGVLTAALNEPGTALPDRPATTFAGGRLSGIKVGVGYAGQADWMVVAADSAVVVVSPKADGVALVWPPVISCQADDVESVERGLMQRLCQEMDDIGTKFAQCLLAPDDAVESTLLERYGFEHATDMFFLARSLTASDREMGLIANDLDHQIYDESMSKELGSMIERTYIGSLDCPFFNDTRTGQDAIASHRLSGCFDPAGWRIYRRGSENIGVLMMNEHPDQDAIELVYFGILPEFRGQGLGREVLADGVHAASLTGRSVLYLAVDCGNIYANALYSELGFAELARRRVMLRRSPQLARK
jgi:ribosomal protein S18 acetylase RimI-like enzyme